MRDTRRIGSVQIRTRWCGAAAVVAILVVITPAGAGTVGAETAGASPGTARGAAATIAAGFTHSCARLGTGSVKCWGYNSAGELGQGDVVIRGDNGGEMGDNLPAIDLGTGRTATAIAAGNQTSCALLDNGAVKCWGSNLQGQLGLGNTTNRGDNANEMGDNLPSIDLGTGRTATAIAVGEFHTCALLDNGAVKCWGLNLYGELGQGDTDERGDNGGEMGDNLPAVALGSGRTATAITAGAYHTCALLDNGSVKCWGWNFYGQLGLGNTTNRGDNGGEMGDFLPAVSLGTGRTATAITAGTNHTCAVLDDRTVKCWGQNGGGQLGLGDTASRGDNSGEMGDDLLAVALGSGRTATAVTAGMSHTCAVLDTGLAKCWGFNFGGQLGLGDTSTRGDGAGEMGDFLPAVSLGTARTAVAITAGRDHTCAALDNGTLKCWGYNVNGPLGLGDTAHRGDNLGEMGDALLPVALGTGLSVVPVVATPGPPTNPVAAAGPARVDLSWMAPGDDGGAPVSGYRIESSPDGVSWVIVAANTNSSATTRQITGLTPGVSIRFRVAAINAAGASPPTLGSAPVTPHEIGSLSPARLLDTRQPDSTIDGLHAGGGPAAAGSVTEVQITGRGGVPADAVAAVLNVTVVGPALAGFATVFDCGAVPTASNLNYQAGQDIPNAVVARLSPTGSICVYTFAEAHLLIDVNGYVPAGSNVGTLTPARLLDTRSADSTIDGLSAGGGPAAAGTVTEVQITGRGGVPADAVAAVLNVTVVGPALAGFATVFDCGAVPTASNLNYQPGQDIPNAVITKLSPTGSICVYTDAQANLLIDVNGHVPAAASLFTLSPVRLLDTRSADSTIDGLHAGGGPQPAGSVTEVQITGRGGVPAGAIAAILNVTIVGPAAAGFATVYGCGAIPTASNLNYQPGQDIPNAVITKLSPAGSICVYTDAQAHLLIDVNGHLPG